MSINAHPELPEFDYIHPSSLPEASRFLAEHAGEARPLLGGTDIFVRMRDGVWKDKFLVDVKGLEGTGELRFLPSASNGHKPGLTIGAAVNMNAVIASKAVQEHYPVLAEACRWVALSALRALQDGAKSRGANAVVDIVSYYKKNEFKSTTSYECYAGAILAGVALKGTYAKVK